MSFLKKREAMLNIKHNGAQSSSTASTSSQQKCNIPYTIKENTTNTRKAYENSPFMSYSDYNTKPAAWCDKYFIHKSNDRKIVGTGFSNSYMMKDDKCKGLISTSFTRSTIKHCQSCDSKVIQETANRCTYLFKNQIPKDKFVKDLNYSLSKHNCNNKK